MAYGVLEPTVGYGSVLTIEELAPSGAGLKPRKVTLTGPSLPHMGAEWAVENNLITTWYPGNGVEATQQVLGPRELPSTWEGEWRRTLMGKHPAILSDASGGESRVVSPHVLREAVEDIARAGVRLRVTWSVRGTEAVGSVTSGQVFTGRKNPDGSVRHDRVANPTLRTTDVQIVREGRVKTFRTPIDRHTDIRWSIEFHWVSRGGRQDRVSSVKEDDAAENASLALQASINATINATNQAVFASNRNVRKSATRLTLGQLENLAGAPQRLTESLSRQLQQNVNNFKRVGEIGKKFRAQPLAVTNAVVDFARNTLNVANNFRADMSRRPPEAKTNKQKVSALLRAQNTFSRIEEAAALNARKAQELEAAQRKAVVSGAGQGALTVRESASTRAGAIIGIHVCKTGETPQTVSSRYYGNPDQGVAILKANRMPWTTPTFRSGAILVIPAISNATSQASK